MSSVDFLLVSRPAEAVADGVWTVGGQGNSLLVDRGDGLLLVDAGPGGEVTDAMIARVRAVSDKPITHVVFSHGHLGYNNGLRQWLAHAAQRGEPRPQLLAHERVPVRYARYRETAGLQAHLNARQFRTAYPERPPEHWFTPPDLTYRERMRVAGPARDVVLLHAPSETDDVTAVWLPGERVLYGSAAFIKSCPNAGTPLRTLRDPMRWVDTLERLLALRADVLIPEFGAPLRGREAVDEALELPIRAMRWLRAEVVARMNRGMTEAAILNDIRYPDELFGHRWMKPGYGCPDYLVREIWRTENGWWDRNPTHLHPADPGRAAAEVLAAVGDARRVLEHARGLQARGEVQLALHVVDLVALAPGEDPVLREARELKAALLVARAAQQTSFVSRNLLKSEAELLVGRPIGSLEGEAAGGFEWR